jgi:CHAT domain-containing protein/Tfp pilus assembly protein PilF
MKHLPLTIALWSITLALACQTTPPATSENLYNSALRAYSFGQVDSAKYYFKQAETAFASSPNDWDIIGANDCRVWQLFLKQQFKEAKTLSDIGYARFSSLIKKQGYGNEQLVRVGGDMYEARIIISEMLGDYEGMLDNCKEWVAMMQASPLKNGRLASLAYGHLGRTYQILGLHKESLPPSEKAYQIKKELIKDLSKSGSGQQSELLIQQLSLALNANSLGTVYFYLEDYDSALRFFQEAHKIRQEHPEGIENHLAQSLYNIANIHELRGDYDLSLESYKATQAIIEKLFGPDHPETADVYARIGAVYAQKRDFDKSLDYFQRALNAQHAYFNGSDAHDVYILTDFGDMLYNKGDYPAALNKFRQALNLVKNIEQEDSYPDICKFIALCEQKLGDKATAAQYYEKTLDWYERRPDFQLSIAKTKNDYASFLMENGQLAESKKQLLDSEAIYKSKNTFSHADAIGCYTLLAKINNDRPEQFMQYWRQALALCVRQGVDAENAFPRLNDLMFPFEAIDLYRMKAQRLHQSGQYDATLAMLRYCAQLIDELRPFYRTVGSKSVLSKTASDTYDLLLAYSAQRYQSTRDRRYFEMAFEALEKSKSSLLLESTNGLEAKALSNIPKAVLDKERDYKSEISARRGRLHYLKESGTGGPKDIVETENLLFRLNERYNKFLDSLEKSYPKFYDLRFNYQTASAADVQRHLPKRTSLLNYHLSDSALYIFLVGEEGLALKTMDIGKTLRDDIGRFRAAILASNYADFTEYGAKLHRQLIAPVAGHLERAERLVVVPSGELNFLPFDLLISNIPPKGGNFQNLPYLLKEKTISYQFSATLYQKNPPKGNGTYFLGVAPFFQDTSFALLPFAQKEVEAAHHRFGGQLLRGKLATKTAFRKLAADADIIHLATHTVIDNANPLFSKLIFFSETGEEGYLHTNELYNMELNAGLAVLSACNSGIGKYFKGEGVMSLAHGFAYAGCPNVVVTNWSVSDKATSDIMLKFYGHLADGMDTDAALRQAKLDFLDEKGRIHSSPYYWGGFMFIGNANAILQNNRNWKNVAIWAIAGMGMLFLAQRLSWKKHAKTTSQ